ncbi:MAG: TatD family hydrolase [Alistipes sp.]|nr:TatD family hydrolase [Alistipes sp.]
MNEANEIIVDIHTHHPRCGVLSPTMAGIHPWDAERGMELPDLTQCNIVGETGLDYACDVDKAAQERLFRDHLAAAERLHKPVVLHVVKAFEPTIKILANYDLKGVVFHGFIGSEQQALEALRRGYYLSFGVRLLRSPKTRQAIVQTPLERLFCETDDDSALDIIEIYTAVAALKGVTFIELREQIYENYKRLFRLR